MDNVDIKEILVKLNDLGQRLPTSSDINSISIELGLLASNLNKLDQKLDQLSGSIRDPHDGLIVQVNKNTDFRKDFKSEQNKIHVEFNKIHRKLEENKVAFSDIVNESKTTKKWKTNVEKGIWFTITSTLTIGAKIVWDLFKA